MTSIVVIGDLVTDVVAEVAEPIATGTDTAARIHTGGGGSGANVATWLAHAGEPVAFVGCVGDDDNGRLRVAQLVAAGVTVHVAVDDQAPTGTVIVLVGPDGERTMLPDRGANLALTPDRLPEDVIAAAGHLHLSGYTFFSDATRPSVLRALEIARAAGATTSVDPSSAGPLDAIGADTFLRWTAGIDLCLPNRAEAAVLTGTNEAHEAARRLGAHYRQVVVTCGADGAIASDGTTSETVAAGRIAVRDTTGAGDAFTAGYLGGFVAGDAPARCLAAGAALADLAVMLPGARPPAPESQ